MRLKDIRIGRKLIASFILVAALTGVVGYLGVSKIYEIDDADTMLYEKMTIPIGQVADMATYFQRMRVNVRDHINATNDADKKRYYDRIFELKALFDKAEKDYEATLFTDDGRRLWEASTHAMDKYMSFMPELEKFVMANDLEGANAIMTGDMQKANAELQKALDDLYQSKLAHAKQTADHNTEIANAASTMMLIVVILAVVFAITIGIVISNSITTPLGKGVAFAQEIAAGNLTVALDVDQKDEVGILGNALGQMQEKLKEVIASVMVGSDNIAAASMQMSSGSQQVSQGASEQASSAEEVSSSMEEMAANIQQNTDNAQEADKISQKVQEGVNKVGSASKESLISIKNIAEKISIINDIAFQTNILALNAAVEAARAGEQGRGFAVVAAEVRKLAERSKIAADEIVALSSKSVNVTENASQLMEGLIPEIERTAKLVQEIAAASMEQSSGADQVNTAIQQLNQVTQQNAAASEEMATSAEELSSQAEQLKEIIGYFTIENKKASTFKRQQQHPAQSQQHHAHSQQTTRTKQFASNGNAKAKGVNLKMSNGEHAFQHTSKFAPKVTSNDSDFENF